MVSVDNLTKFYGPKRAIRFVQQVCNAAGFGPVDEDGIMGPQTRSAAIAADDQMGDLFLNALVEERRNFYRLIVARDESQRRFLAGWLNRADEFEVKGVA